MHITINRLKSKIVILERSEESPESVNLSSLEILSVFISFQSSLHYAQTRLRCATPWQAVVSLRQLADSGMTSPSLLEH